ncbi:MAG: SPOR domain-containing protein [Sphingomonadales bacterium]|nr:SPOR domain-containing protein [Sphingomonadales bacterium]
MTGDENSEGGPLAGIGDAANETLGNLQARLTEHGRKLAEAAGERVSGAVDAAGEQVQGLAAATGLGATSGGHDAAPEEPHDDGRLDLEEHARLPWLESGDDDDGYDGGVDTRRVALFVAAGLALLAAIVGGIWWSTHRGAATDKVADGSVIKAEPGAYKTAPANPGGKTYEGTGDSSYEVSQGKNPAAHLGDAASAAAGAAGAAAGGAVKTAEQAGQVAVAAAKSAGAAAAEAANAAGHAAAGGTVAGPGGGTGVQVGAYTTQASAEAGWAKLQKQYTPLASMHHRIVQGQADIGTVYRLQAVTDSDGAASSLCSGMKAAGLACQVKH